MYIITFMDMAFGPYLSTEVDEVKQRLQKLLDPTHSSGDKLFVCELQDEAEIIRFEAGEILLDSDVDCDASDPMLT